MDEMERLRSHDETIANFELNCLDNISLEDIHDGASVSVDTTGIVDDSVNGGVRLMIEFGER